MHLSRLSRHRCIYHFFYWHLSSSYQNLLIQGCEVSILPASKSFEFRFKEINKQCKELQVISPHYSYQMRVTLTAMLTDKVFII